VVTHYEVLGVGSGAPAGEIRRAYLRLVRTHHPDAKPGASAADREDAGRHIRAINAAWTVLGHPARRRAYDESLRIGTNDRFTVFEEDEDGPDPRLEPDVPYRPDDKPSPLRRLATLAPVLLVLFAVGAFSMAMLVSSAALVALSFGLLLLAGALFVLMPLLYMSDARRHG